MPDGETADSEEMRGVLLLRAAHAILAPSPRTRFDLRRKRNNAPMELDGQYGRVPGEFLQVEAVG